MNIQENQYLSEAIKKEFIKYLKHCKGNLNEILEDYVKSFSELYEIYNIPITALVFINPENTIVRFCLSFNDKNKVQNIVILSKELKQNNKIFFTKNWIIIQKELNPLSISIPNAVYDLALIKEQIEQSELERLSKNL